jgi:ribose 5-phosphate isomerase B
LLNFKISIWTGVAVKVVVGFDHAGFPLKQTILEAVSAAGHEPIDVGTHSAESVDFPDISEKVGRAVQSGQAERGILVCGSGVGACIAANKLKGVWASICHDTYSARQGVLHDDMNVLCLGGRVVGPELAKVLVAAFLNARYIGNDQGGERLARRVEKIKKLDEGKSLEG